MPRCRSSCVHVSMWARRASSSRRDAVALGESRRPPTESMASRRTILHPARASTSTTRAMVASGTNTLLPLMFTPQNRARRPSAKVKPLPGLPAPTKPCLPAGASRRYRKSTAAARGKGPIAGLVCPSGVWAEAVERAARADSADSAADAQRRRRRNRRRGEVIIGSEVRERGPLWHTSGGASRYRIGTNSGSLGRPPTDRRRIARCLRPSRAGWPPWPWPLS
jgi:hypothetical protein